MMDRFDTRESTIFVSVVTTWIDSVALPFRVQITLRKWRSLCSSRSLTGCVTEFRVTSGKASLTFGVRTSLR